MSNQHARQQHGSTEAVGHSVKSHYRRHGHALCCFLYWELKHNILAGQLLVHSLEGLDLPLCAVPVLGVQVHLQPPTARS